MPSDSTPSIDAVLPILEALARGCHPFSGATLEGPAWLLDPRCKAAFDVARASVREQVRAAEPDVPRRHGKAWPVAEEDDLVAAFVDGASVDHLAKRHGRTPWAIRSRLTRVGLLDRVGPPADRDFGQAFALGWLRLAGFDHRAHLRVAYSLLLEHPVSAATDRLRDGLQAMLERAGPQARYHETRTVAWVRVVAARMASVGAGAHFHAFIDRHLDLLDRAYIQRHYSSPRLGSEDAHRYFLPADREPLPPPPRTPEPAQQ